MAEATERALTAGKQVMMRVEVEMK